MPWRHGATKRMKLADLAAKALAAEALEQQQEALETMVQKNTAAALFVKQLDAMAPEDQAAFRHVLANPSLARRLVQEAGVPGPEAEDDEDDAPAARPVSNGNLNSRERQTLDFLLAEHQKREQQEAGSRLSAAVDETMKAYHVFGENDVAARWAKDSILMALAHNPRLKLDDVVAAHANKTHAMLQAERERQLGAQSNRSREGGVPRVPSTFPPAAPGKQPTAEDLMSGRIGKRLLGRA